MTSLFYTDEELVALLSKDPLAFAQLINHGTPLIDPDSTMMTFVFEAPETESVHLWINRLTDKERTELGAMKQIPGTNFWVLTIDIPHSLAASYCFRIGSNVQHPPGYNNYPHHRDPHARSGQLIVSGEQGLSLLLGQKAQLSPWWQNIDHNCAPHHRLHQAQVEQCSTYLYLPPTNKQPVPLVILTDAEVWFPRLKLDQALDRAISTGNLPPCAIAAVGFKDSQHRRTLLTNFDLWHTHLMQSVLPWAQHQAAEHSYRISNSIIIAGQSLGGLAALALSLYHPNDFSAVIAQSPSLWWHDSPDASPRDFSKQVIPWLVSEVFTHAGPNHPTAYLDIGIREGLSVSHMHGLTAAMNSIKWQHELSIVDGGHDYAWWRETLLHHLAQVLTS